MTKRALAAAGLLVLTAGCIDLGQAVDDGPPGDPPPLPEPSSVEFVLPEDGATLDAETAFSVTGDGISTVRFKMDGAVVLEDAASPFEWTLDPASHEAGTYEIVVEVVHDGGTETRTISVTVPGAEPPPPSGIQFFLPAEGATLTAPAVLSVSGDGITSVRFEVDGTTVLEDTTSPFEWTLNPGSYDEGVHAVVVQVEHAAGTESRTRNVTTAPAPTGGDQPAEVFEAVRDLAPGHWYEIPNTHLRDVAADFSAPAGGIGGIMKAWSSGAFDTKRNRLVVFGGGHADYAGNEIYVFDLDDLKWIRVNDPSPLWPSDPGNEARNVEMPDGTPVSRHTYEYIDYIPPPVDRFFVGGGDALWSDGQFGDPHAWLFDFETKTWKKGAQTIDFSIGAVNAVGPDGRVWQHSNKWGLSVYDPVKDTWTQWQMLPTWFGYTLTADFDSRRNRFVVIGKGQTRWWNTETPALPVAYETSGDDGIEGAESPGFVYHAPSDRFVAWAGGADVYTLDMSTLRWTRHATSGSVSPGDAVAAGTFGRFRYSPTSNLFVVVNSVDRNVFVYRLPE